MNSIASDPFKELPEPVKSTKEELKEAIVRAVNADAQGLREAGLLFSGGVDSTLLAVLLRDKLDLHCYCAGMEGSKDIPWAERAARQLGLKLETIMIKEDELAEALPRVVGLVGKNIMKVGVAMPFYFCMRDAPERVFFSGLGSEELFAGYQRHWKALEEKGYKGVEKEIRRGLQTMWERDLTRDLAIAEELSKELRLPFLDAEVVERSLGIPAEEKIARDAPLKKLALREIALELGVPEEVAKRPKKAAQYGSGVDKALRKIWEG